MPVGQSMESAVKEAMDRGGIADITTIGRKTGEERRIEIYFHQFDGAYYLTGKPGRPRDWNANIIANPEFTIHLKKGVTADVEVVGEPEPDREERAQILRRALVESWGSEPEKAEASLHKWVNTSPFIRFRPVEES
ncbi:MAG: nitroreductase family deazaflavin-dependent oxidoreductase [Acidobacteria bacterium]|nr:nitroreductase family deazaflavin-dependent oxidoreductase [Acidobacteriota bacterium]